MSRLIIDVAWNIDGPFSTAGGDVYGVFDRCFHRAAGHWLSVSKTHVKGKLREGAQHLADVYEVHPSVVEWWLGAGNEKGNQAERLFVSDLRPDTSNQHRRTDLDAGKVDAPSTLDLGPLYERFTEISGAGASAAKTTQAQRTAIGEAGTAAAHTLRIEEIQPRGLSLWWKGRIETAGPSDQLQAVAALICSAGRCISQFGGDKGVGYGKVRAFEASLWIDGNPQQTRQLKEVVSTLAARKDGRPSPHSRTGEAVRPNVADAPRTVGLELIPIEPVYVAGVKRPQSHFNEGLDYFSGSVLKGAVAAAMNLAVGVQLDAPICAANTGVHERWPELATHFESVRFLHGMPGGPLDPSAEGSRRRSFRVPLSAFATNKRGEHVSDAALDSIPTSTLPYFAPDCDDLTAYIRECGLAGTRIEAVRVARSVVSRTGIDPKKLRAANEMLFGYSEIAEVVKSDTGIPTRQSFLTKVTLPDDGNGLAAKLWQQLSDILPHLRLGKTNAAVAVRSWSSSATSLEERIRSFDNAPIVLTLMSDTLLPFGEHRIDASTSMTTLYDEAWRRILKHRGYDHPSNAPLIRDVFARQNLRGGWAGRRGRPSSYRCFHMTEAGSAFVTSVAANQCSDELRQALESLEIRGIPILEPNVNWENCTYMPENGFGEVAVCHPWHRERRSSATCQNGESK